MYVFLNRHGPNARSFQTFGKTITRNCTSRAFRETNNLLNKS